MCWSMKKKHDELNDVWFWLLHCSLRLLDDKDKPDWLDSVDDNRVEEEDEEAAEVVDEPLDDDDSSRTIDLKKEF